jgi:hypothetical protein
MASNSERHDFHRDGRVDQLYSFPEIFIIVRAPLLHPIKPLGICPIFQAHPNFIFEEPRLLYLANVSTLCLFRCVQIV